MSPTDITILGPYVTGEIPEAWIHQFLDADGNAIDLSGYTVKLTYRLDAGTQVVRDGTLVDAATGKAGYTWIAADLATAGVLRGELTVGNGVNRYARSFHMRVREPSGGALPTI